jgi:hypothetical protein
LLGFYGALWSRLNLASEWRGAPEVRADHKLITSGPYQFTRHPIYSSLLLMQIGSALTTLYWLSFVEVCITTVAYTIKAISEEEMLLQVLCRGFSDCDLIVVSLCFFLTAFWGKVPSLYEDDGTACSLALLTELINAFF